MSVNAFRIWNFMGFEDSDWIELKPINLLFGRNSTGKSALLRALLLLRQSLDSPPSGEPLTLFSEDGVNAGSWQDIVHRHSKGADVDYSPGTVVFGFRCEVKPTVLQFFLSEEEHSKAKALREPIVPPENAWAKLRLAYGRESTSKSIILQKIEIYLPWMSPDLTEDKSTLIFEAEWTEVPEYGPWYFNSPILDPRRDPNLENLWDQVTDFGKAKGFLPGLSAFDKNGENENNVLDNREEYKAIRELLEEFSDVITTFLNSIHYLGPVRSEPRRLYYVPRASARRARRRGTNTMENFLTSWGSPEWEEKKKAINARLAELELGIEFEVRPLDHDEKNKREPSIFEVILKEDEDTTGSNLSDSGFGWSQMLPFVVQSVLAEEGATVIIEEPEAHLHPGAQAQLGDLFIRIAKTGVSLIIETHSEYLLLRLRRRIAETTAKQAPISTQIEAKSVIAYFIDRLGGQSLSQEINLDKFGDFEKMPAGFRDFFADDMTEILALSRATRRAESLESKT